MDGDQDAELQALRARRMAEMQAQYGGVSKSNGRGL